MLCNDGQFELLFTFSFTNYYEEKNAAERSWAKKGINEDETNHEWTSHYGYAPEMRFETKNSRSVLFKCAERIEIIPILNIIRSQDQHFLPLNRFQGARNVWISTWVMSFFLSPYFIRITFLNIFFQIKYCLKFIN